MKILNRFTLILLGIIAGILCIEGLFHFDKKYSFDAMVYRQNFCTLKELHQFRNSEILGYEFVPNASKDINSFGMRDKEYSLVKPKGVYRILLLGDSITEIGKWSEYVEDKLNRYGNYEILNCAVRGWNLYNYYAYMKYKALKFNPDLVLIGFCLNDCDGSDVVFMIRNTNLFDEQVVSFTLPNNIENKSCILKINPYLFGISYIYRWFVSNFIFNKNAGKYRSVEIESIKEELDFIKKQAGGNILAIVYPFLKPLNTYDANEQNEYAQTIEALNETGIKHLDLTGYFNSYGKDIVKFRERPDDKIHFDDEANKLKAQVIYDWLVKQLKDLKNSKDK